MGSLTVCENLENYDDVYQVIIDMHRGMTDEESEKANAKLILLLANHIGDLEVIREAAAIVRSNTPSTKAE
ncbi:MAG: DUF2783 domain-containing protein [Alphaproteobacteria bacterium]|nr:DUF2783 domain-containing protein [Alphaproteobacteria bacterium]